MSFNFGRKKNTPKVSVCIPVYNTEQLLGRCLTALAEQNFSDLELVLINDQSSGKDANGSSCKKIVSSFSRKSKIPLVYIEHNQKVPLLETRRELVEQAHGEYILMVDSDDFLAPGAVGKLYESAVSTGADITCARERVYKIQNGNYEITEESYACFTEGKMTEREILDSWLHNKSSAFLWAKLIKRELYLEAFAEMPYMDCSISVDTPIYFFIAYHAKSYVGINEVVYYYLVNEGITSNKPIKDLDTWKRHCSVASIYTLLLTFEGDLTDEEKEALRNMSNRYVLNSVVRLRNQVIPELYTEARKLTCEYWGSDYVEFVEEMLDKSRPLKRFPGQAGE